MSSLFLGVEVWLYSYSGPVLTSFAMDYQIEEGASDCCVKWRFASVDAKARKPAASTHLVKGGFILWSRRGLVLSSTPAPSPNAHPSLLIFAVAMGVFCLVDPGFHVLAVLACPLAFPHQLGIAHARKACSRRAPALRRWWRRFPRGRSRPGRRWTRPCRWGLRSHPRLRLPCSRRGFRGRAPVRGRARDPC